MEHLKKLCAATVLTFALAFSAFADGHMDTGFTTPGHMDTGFTSTTAGHMDTGFVGTTSGSESTSTDTTTQFMLFLVSMLAPF